MKKIIELIKKLLGSSDSTSSSDSSKGFTLIELLVVIAVIGILAAATLIAVDPVERINAGNDSRVQSDVKAVATASEAYAASNNGLYAAGDFNAATNTMINAGALKSAPVPPGGYTAYTYTLSGTDIVLTGQLKSQKYTATPVWKYFSSTGRSCATTTSGGC